MAIWKRNLYVCWFGAFITMVGISQMTTILPLYIEDKKEAAFFTQLLVYSTAVSFIGYAILVAVSF